MLIRVPKISPFTLRLIILTTTLLLWEAIIRTGNIPPSALASPTQILTATLDLLTTPDLVSHLARTLQELSLAFTLAVLLGIPIGILFYKIPPLATLLEPYLDALYAVPLLLFYPLFLVFFGIGPWGIVFIAMTMAIVPIIINTRIGLQEIRPIYRKLSTLNRLTPTQNTLKILIPASAPYLFAGLKLGFIYALIGTIAMEFILTDSGIGFAVNFNYNFFKTPTMYAYITLIIALSALFYLIISTIERTLLADQTVILRASPHSVTRNRWFNHLPIIALIFLLWLFLSRTDTVATPTETFQRIATLIRTGDLFPHLTATFTPVILGFALALVVGIAIGALMGANRYWYKTLEPLVLTFYAVPKITIFPVFILLFGLGLNARIIMAFIHAVFPIIIVMMAGVRDINPVYARLSRSSGATLRQTIIKIYLPAVLPAMLSAIQIGFSLAIIGVVLSEFFASRAGLGFLIMDAYALYQLDKLFAVIVILYTLAFTFNLLMLSLHRRLA